MSEEARGECGMRQGHEVTVGMKKYEKFVAWQHYLFREFQLLPPPAISCSLARETFATLISHKHNKLP
jgi:hypothetical protein